MGRSTDRRTAPLRTATSLPPTVVPGPGPGIHDVPIDGQPVEGLDGPAHSVMGKPR